MTYTNELNHLRALYADAARAISNEDVLSFPLDALAIKPVRDAIINTGSPLFWNEISCAPHATPEVQLTATLASILRAREIYSPERSDMLDLAAGYMRLCARTEVLKQEKGKLNDLTCRLLLAGVDLNEVLDNLLTGSDEAQASIQALAG